MAFKFINAASTGDFQTVFNRQVEDPDTISLTDDTPGANSTKSIPFDGLDDYITFDGIIELATHEPSPTALAFDAFLKNSVTAINTRYTFFDASIVKDSASSTTGYDGFYIGSIVVTGATNSSYVEFRVNHDSDFEYVLTSDASITTTAWHNVFCNFNSANQTMEIWIDRTLDSLCTLTDLLPTTATPLGQRGINFGGRLDEVRLWAPLGDITASAMGQIGSVTGIGSRPEELNGGAGVNEFTPSANSFIAWWDFDSVSAVELVAGIANIITDNTGNDHTGTPKNFSGSDIVSAETTIIQGISASGDLQVLLGGSLDHGGLLAIDPEDDTLVLEQGHENLLTESDLSFTTTGADVSTTEETSNFFYGSSALRVQTTGADTGIFTTFSNSAILYPGNVYTASMRIRSLSGSTSAIVTLEFGANTNTITAAHGSAQWFQFALTGTPDSSTTGKLQILQAAGADGALFVVDGVQLSEGDFPNRFIGPGRIRKSGQLHWLVEG